MDTRTFNAGLRLPAFVTADSLAEMLNWVNSLKREFRETARSQVIPGWTPGISEQETYQDIVRLLAIPGGGRELDRLVGVADEKRRGLTRALHRRALSALGPDLEKGDGPIDVVFKLQVADDPALAAWVAFERMTWTNGPDPIEGDAFVDYLSKDEDLQARLGDFWTDWLALPNLVLADEVHAGGAERLPTSVAKIKDAITPTSFRQDHVEADVGPSAAQINDAVSVNSGDGMGDASDPADADRTAWLSELEDLRKTIELATPFDPLLPARLTAASARLETLVAASSERRALREAILSDLAATHLEDLRTELEAFGSDINWRDELVGAAARLPADADAIERLTAVSEWARTARDRAEAAADRRATALDRVQADDSDEAGLELSAANANRRRIRLEIDGEASSWIEAFRDGSPLGSTPALLEIAPPASTSPNVLQTAAMVDELSPAQTGDANESTNSPGVSTRTSAEDGVAASNPDTETCVKGGASPVDYAPTALTNAQPPVDDDTTTSTESVDVPHSELSFLSGYNRLINEALRAGRRGLAAHLQHAVEVLGAQDPTPAPSAVLEALCIGGAINATRLPAAEHRYAAVLPKVLADLGRPSACADSMRLVAFAGAIKPALFSIQAAAAEVIRAAGIGGLGTHLHELSEFVLEDLPKRGGVIDLIALRPVGDEQDVRDETERLRRQLLEMADGAPAKKALFARASFIWRELFQRDSAVPRAITALRRSASNTAALAQEAANELDQHLADRARNLDRAAKRNRDAWLEGKALEWLLTSVRELRDLLHAYASAANRAAGPKSTHTAETQKILVELVDAARQDLSACALRPELATAAAVASDVLDDVAAILAGQLGGRDPDLGLDALLDDDLLLIRPYPVGARGKSLTRDGAVALLEGAETMLETSPDFTAAFEWLVEAGHFDEAAAAGERTGRQGADRLKQDHEIADARLERLHRIETRMLNLRARLDDLLGADTDGLIDPASSAQLESLIAGVIGSGLDPQEVSQRLDFPKVEAELAVLERAVEDGAELLLAPLRREIDALGVRGRTADIMRDLAERRELTTLRECVNGVRDGADMDLTGQQEKLLRSFAEGFLSQAFAQTDPKQRNVAELVQTVKERPAGSVVDFSLLAEEDVAAAEGLLVAWQKLKRSDEAAQVAVRELLTELRFTNVRISAERKMPRAHRYTLLFDATSDRRDCPVPAFGSAANGRMEVLVVEASAVADGVELHGVVKSLEHSSTIPTLVVVKGVLPAERRLAFMREARRRAGQEPCALLDEAAVLFLATWPARRRADFFAVALPSGGVQPYSDASGKTSPEMFFGRSAELGELWRPDGSCLVFGGRQLGKTALLEQVRLRNHKPPGQVVVYGSLQGDTDVWRLVARLLTDGGVAVKGHSAGAVETAVRDWLRDNEARRILVLVDEADTYLEAEMRNGYPSLARVRDLMQSTKRRCKFVFAGLHNVQRLARAPNSPLLHFGTPLRIGPLFGHDLGEAREMVVGPMAAAGIVFGNATLPNRILSAVGFYPSLLQTFGGTLIDRVNKNAHGRLKTGALLPIVVADHDIQNALEDQYFKENIRQKFRMTLSLDERYRLITLAMLQRSLDRREQTGLAPSMTDVEVQALARDWWPQGFEEDSSLDAFQGLLQEMVGLGVLVVSGDRYAIRSSRIAAMLGGKEQIEQELVELSESPGPEKLDTGSLRRLDKTTRAPSPLTSRQEGQLLGSANSASSVHLALGSRALGLDRVAVTLGELQDDELSISASNYKTSREFGMQLASAREAIRPARRNLLVLTGPWLGREMVDIALEASVRRPGRSGSLRIVIAPSWVDWDVADEIEEGRLWGAELLSLSTLGRSGLGQWLRARGAQDAGSVIEDLRALTGGYPSFLAGLGRAADPLAAAQEAYDRHIANPDTLSDLGLQEGRLLVAARIIAEYEPHDPAGDLESMGVASGAKVVGHLERLGILDAVQEAGETRLRLNPFVAAVLSRQS